MELTKQEQHGPTPSGRYNWKSVVRVVLGLGVGVLLAWALLVWLTWMPGDSWEGAPPPLTAEQRLLHDRLQAHVQMLAGEIGPRHIGKPRTMQRSVAYIRGQLEEVGYDVTLLPVPSDEGTTYTVEARLKGTLYPDSSIVVGAHYDTVQQTPGADDNATGVAAVLELARLLHATPSERTLRFVLFTHEEPPYFKTEAMGSWVYAHQARQRGDTIEAMLSIEMLGHFSEQEGSQTLPPPLQAVYPTVGNFVAFVAVPEASELLEHCIKNFREHAKIASEAIAAPAWVQGVDFSDHWSFMQQGYPAVMVTDTAFMRNMHYHKATDTPDRIAYTYLTHTVLGLTPVIRELATK